MSPEKTAALLELEELLSQLFSQEELRRWASGHLPATVIDHLPGDIASLATLVHAIVRLSERHGLLTSNFFKELTQARTSRQIDIELVEALFSALSPAGSVPSPSVTGSIAPRRSRARIAAGMMTFASLAVLLLVAAVSFLTPQASENISSPHHPDPHPLTVTSDYGKPATIIESQQAGAVDKQGRGQERQGDALCESLMISEIAAAFNAQCAPMRGTREDERQRLDDFLADPAQVQILLQAFPHHIALLFPPDFQGHDRESSYAVTAFHIQGVRALLPRDYEYGIVLALANVPQEGGRKTKMQAAYDRLHSSVTAFREGLLDEETRVRYGAPPDYFLVDWEAPLDPSFFQSVYASSFVAWSDRSQKDFESRLEHYPQISPAERKVLFQSISRSVLLIFTTCGRR